MRAAPVVGLICGVSLGVLVALAPAGEMTRGSQGLHASQPSDVRLGPLRDLDTHAPFTPPPTAEAWAMRSAQLRRQLRVALGLWPWPTRTPLEARVHRTVKRDGYVVEAVAFESLPGHVVTGSLYRPSGRPGRLPAVLSPHGHWPGGRFQSAADEEVERALANGAEPFEGAARHPLQARAVHLARMGAIVLFLDMEGYADSQQIPEAVAHGFRSRRPHMHGPDTWGFFSPRAELHLQSVMGLQTWNIIRALDYIAARDDVDPARIGVTGASGGGTQTFILAALDPRPAAVFPAVMVSTGMQGGCTCENASYLRTGTGNVEIAALAAPRPLGMTAADDWTRDVERDGYPELRRIFGLLGAPDHVTLRSFPQFGHNYNGPARAVMYEWFNRHLRLGWQEVPPERPFVPLTREEASVWGSAHAPPAGGEPHERTLLAWLRDDSDRQLSSRLPRHGAALAAYREMVGGAFEAMIGRGLPPAGAVTLETTGRTSDGHATTTTGLLRLGVHREALPAVLLSPPGRRDGIVVWPQVEGKAALLDGGRAGATVRRLLAAGYEVLGVDTLHQGEFRAGKAQLLRTQLASTRAHAGYTFGYNHPLPVARTHDVLTAVRFARDRVSSGTVVLVAAAGAAGWAAAARAVAGAAVDRLVVDPAGFRFADVDRIDHPDFFPGSAKYGDLPALLTLSAPQRTVVLDDRRGDLGMVQDGFAAAGRSGALTIVRADGSSALADGVLEP